MPAKVINPSGFTSYLEIDNASLSVKSFSPKRDVTTEIMFLQVTLITDGTVGDRNLRLRWEHYTTVFDIAAYSLPVTQPANTTKVYLFNRGIASSYTDFDANDQFIVPLPMWEFQPPSSSVATADKVYIEDANEVSSGDVVQYTLCARLWNT